MRRDKKTHTANNSAPITPSALKRAALLEDLGRSANEQPLFSLPSPLVPWGVIPFAILVTAIAPPLIKDGPVGALVAAAIALLLFTLVLIPRKLFIGLDGIQLVSLFGSRFIRFRDIDYVETSDGFYFHHPGINIVLVNGGVLDFTTSMFKERWAERDALILLIRESCETAKRKKPASVQQVLLRSGKTYGAWARALLTMGSGAHFDPRAPAVVPEDLLTVAENPDASTMERTAACIALRACKDANFDARLRVSLDQTAAPACRSAFRDALEAGDDEARLAAILERTEKMAAHE